MQRRPDWRIRELRSMQPSRLKAARTQSMKHFTTEQRNRDSLSCSTDWMVGGSGEQAVILQKWGASVAFHEEGTGLGQLGQTHDEFGCRDYQMKLNCHHVPYSANTMLNVPRLQLAFSGQIAKVRMECQARTEVVRLQIVLLHHFLSNKADCSRLPTSRISLRAEA